MKSSPLESAVICRVPLAEAAGWATTAAPAGLPKWLSGKEFTCPCRGTGSVPGWRRSLGEGCGNLLHFLAWEIPWTEESGGLQSMGSQRRGHDLATKQ